MRISFALQRETTLSSINRKQEDVMRLSEAIASGKQLTAASEDPSAWAQSMTVKQGLREYDSILENIEFATGWNKSTDAALSNLSNLISQAREAGITASSGSTTDKKAAVVAELTNILQDAVKAANAQHGEQYIFGGTITSTPPYSINDATGAVTYTGDEAHIQVRTDRGGNGISTVNLTGPEAISFTNSAGDTVTVLEEIWNLREAVDSGDSTAVTTSLANLSKAFESVNSEATVTGARLSAFEDQTTAISVFKTNEKTTLSDLEDTDLADAITKLEQSQTAFQAALQVTGMLSDLSLTNYI
ncbi:MAG: hypothetical protein LLG06_08135 [Desulfobacteraceae bacterium]|nr:hypothetical protein [Desulfobacteraceae bacterium]